MTMKNGLFGFFFQVAKSLQVKPNATSELFSWKISSSMLLIVVLFRLVENSFVYLLLQVLVYFANAALWVRGDTNVVYAACRDGNI